MDVATTNLNTPTAEGGTKAGGGMAVQLTPPQGAPLTGSAAKYALVGGSTPSPHPDVIIRPSNSSLLTINLDTNSNIPSVGPSPSVMGGAAPATGVSGGGGSGRGTATPLITVTSPANNPHANNPNNNAGSNSGEKTPEKRPPPLAVPETGVASGTPSASPMWASPQNGTAASGSGTPSNSNNKPTSSSVFGGVGSLDLAALAALGAEIKPTRRKHGATPGGAAASGTGVGSATAAGGTGGANGVNKRNSIINFVDTVRKQKNQEMNELELIRKQQLTGKVEPHGKVMFLPRGGKYVQTAAGPIQFGMPPETIKDSMKLGLTLPSIYILPKNRFNLSMGMNVAEFEFPAYYGFFFKRSRTTLVTTKEVEPLIRTIFRETLLGPASIAKPTEFTEDVPESAYPDLAKELSYFRKNPFNRAQDLDVDVLLEFVHFDPTNGVATLKNGVTITDEGDEYVVCEEKVETARVSCNVILPPPSDDEKIMADSEEKLPLENFVPPYFGITMLGNSDGFDAAGRTTGFVLWMNRRGIMVDPPPHSGPLLRKHHIHPRLIHSVILTHCHADHDAGTFQKILEEGRVVLITTEIILGSFLRKYAAISGLSTDFLRRLFVFRPVKPGENLPVFGGALNFFYSLHSIPCVGFSAKCNGKSMIYSADTFNDAKGITKLFEDGFISAGRRDKLIQFPWHHDAILHEAGVPPIHTPISTFENLSADIKQRLYIVHCKAVPEGKGLKRALVGPENTIIISNQPGPDASALEVLDLLGTIDVFSSLGIARGLELVQSAARVKYTAGQTLIEEGTDGALMFVVAMGVVSVYVKGKWVKYLNVGDHFGEMSIVTGEKRTATIRAATDVETLIFNKADFLYLVRDTNAIERLQNLGNMQRAESWSVLMANSVLSRLSSGQKTHLQSAFTKKSLNTGEVVWVEKKMATHAVLVLDGSFVFARAEDRKPFSKGAFIVEMNAMVTDTPLQTTLLCAKTGSILLIAKHDWLSFLDKNPGMRVIFLTRRFVE